MRLCPWPGPRAFLSLASRFSVLKKAVLGLGLGFFLCPWPRFFLCSWPWPRALCPRLHLCSLDHSNCFKIIFGTFATLRIRSLFFFRAKLGLRHPKVKNAYNRSSSCVALEGTAELLRSGTSPDSETSVTSGWARDPRMA